MLSNSFFLSGMSEEKIRCEVCGVELAINGTTEGGNYILYRNNYPICRCCEEDNSVALDLGLTPRDLKDLKSPFFFRVN